MQHDVDWLKIFLQPFVHFRFTVSVKGSKQDKRRPFLLHICADQRAFL